MSAADTRQALLEQACTLFASRGYDAVGVQELCQNVGVTKPTLYHHFGSKTGLLESLVRDYGRGVLERISASARFQGDLPLSLEHVAFAALAAARENPDFYRLLLSQYFAPAESEGHRAVRPLMEHINAVIQELFLQAASRHGNMQGRERAYALSYLGLVHTMIGQELAGDQALADHDVRRLVHWFQYGIYS